MYVYLDHAIAAALRINADMERSVMCASTYTLHVDLIATDFAVLVLSH